MRKLLSLAALAFFASTNIVNAQEFPTDEAKGTFGINGYVDTYYQYNLNRPESGFNQGRVFDLRHDNFAIGLVQTVFTYTKGRATVVADLTFGPNGDLGNFGNEGSARFIKQAYLSYDLTDKLNFTIGQFGTHIGYELIDAPLNANYSLSYLFGNGPFYHTGAKLNYQPSDRLSFMGGVINGWDCLNDFNNKKSLVGQVYVAPVEGWDVYVNWVGGDEFNSLSNFGDARGSFTSLFDLTTSFQLSETLKLGMNAAYGSFFTGNTEVDPGNAWSEDPNWGGAALYASYDFNNKFGLGVRTEYFSDPGGVRYVGPVDVTSLTLTGNVKLGGDGSFLLKPEVRIDKAQGDFFEGANGLVNKKSQTTVGAAFVYSFGK